MSGSIQTADLLGKIQRTLRLRGPLAGDPTARVLHALLVGSSGWMLFNLAVILPFVVPAKTLSIYLDLLLLSSFFAGRVLLQSGFMRQASLVYVGGVWIVTTVVIVLGGAIHSFSFVLYIALPISAAWLLGFRAALWMAAVCLVCTLALAVMAIMGVKPPIYFPGNPLGVWSNVLYATIIATVPTAQVLRTLKEALSASQRDVAERARAEKELRDHQEHLEELVDQRTIQLVEARDQAQAANQAKTTFLANMSHELRTPLNAIVGFSDLLRENRRVPESERRDLDIISRSGQHLLALINDVLDMAKIDAGRIVIENAPLDLSDLASGVLDLMRLRAEDKRLNLSMVEAPGFCQFVRADGEKLRQVLLNLVGNAVKYTERGSILLRLDGEPAADSQRYKLVIEVQDTGIGIAAEDQARIFDPFVQAGKLSTYKGTGLGLAISKKYVGLMGGTIQVESALGRGSVFRVDIPVLKGERSEMPAPGLRCGQIMGLELGQPEYRILIIEDHLENFLLLRRLLENAGFQVSVAENGADGIDQFSSWRPQFIWMDWRLPDMDGLEVTRRIRTLEAGRDVKIAILSAFAFTAYRDEALQAGVDDFVSKPFQAGEIFDSLARHLGVRYRYQGAVTEKTINPLEPEVLASLCGELRKELTDALISLNIERIDKTIDHISEQNAALGSTLSRYAERYAYSSILKGLQSAETMRT